MQGILMTLISFMINQLGFHNTEKRLGYGIVPAVPLAAHALDKFMFIELFTKIGACILDATIRVKDKSPARTTSPYRPLQRRDHHLMAQRTAQRPTNYQAREQIDDHRQIQPTRTGSQVRYI